MARMFDTGWAWWTYPRGAVVVEGPLAPALGKPRPGRAVLIADRTAVGGIRAAMRSESRPLRGTGRESGLFRTFADLRDGEGYARFASAYGPLGDVQPETILVDDRLVLGERVDAWQAAVADMAAAVQAWDALRDWQPGDDPAQRDAQQADLERLVNDHLRTVGTGRPLPAAMVDLGPGDDRPLALRIVPTSLLGALWLQLARAIDLDRDYRPCAQCGQWFELAPEVSRVDRRYCADACRSKAYRQRRKAGTEEHDV